MWVDGRIVAPDEPVLRADDHALVGDGAFEAIKVLDGHPFALDAPSGPPATLARAARHRARPGRRARRAVAALMATEQARVSPSWLRITVTGGSAPMGTGSVGTRPTIVAAVAPMAPWPPTTDVVVAPWRRNEYGPTTGLKTISYADNVIAYRYAHAQGADEAVFANTQWPALRGHRHQRRARRRRTAGDADAGRRAASPASHASCCSSGCPRSRSSTCRSPPSPRRPRRSSHRPAATCTRSGASATSSCRTHPGP